MGSAIERLRHVHWSLAAPIGTGLSLLSLGHLSPFCPDGPAMGFPLSVLRPSHEGSTQVAVLVGRIAGVPYEIFLPGLFANIVLWAAFAALILALVPRRFYASERGLYPNR